MPIPIERPATPARLFLWVMHTFAEVFEDHAVIKGGIALELLGSPRSTSDIDYVMVPFRSKKEVRAQVEAVLSGLGDAEVDIAVHSKMIRAAVRLDGAAIQIEVNVAEECASIPMATGDLARGLGQPSRVVRIMAADHALSHKLAAWNERRLLRDLYDCYFLSNRLGKAPDMAVLDRRLANIDSRRPGRKGRRRMSRSELAAELRTAADELTDTALQQELAPVMPPDELAGLAPRIAAETRRLADRLEA